MQIIKKTKLILLLIALYLVNPLSVFGQTDVSVGTGGKLSFCPGGTSDIRSLLNFFTCLIIESVVPLLMGVATVIFIWGVVQYVINAEDTTKRAEGRSFMIWGIIGLFVIVSIWGLVKLLAGTFGINFVIPQLQE